MNFWERLKLKIISNSWEEYGVLKSSRTIKDKLATYHPPAPFDYFHQPVSVKHSGNSGDIIYSLPYVKGIANGNDVKLFLHANQPVDFSDQFKHPLGRLMLNEKMIRMLQPLFLAQDWIAECNFYEDQPIDIDLDLVRQAPLPVTKICLPRWYFMVFGATFDLHAPWLKAFPDESVQQTIVVARSSRYHGHKIDYSFLRRYPDIQFLGVEEEFDEMKKMIPQIKYRPVKDFLEMAAIISGCRLFIGNQSFPFALAEALKANRLLEVSVVCPDVCVNGAKGQQFYFQEHFENLVKRWYA